MDGTTLILGLLFSSIGMGYFMYGRKAAHFAAMGAGMALMVCPFLISNAAALSVVSVLLAAVPFVWRGEA